MDNFLHQFKNSLLIPITKYLIYIEKLIYLKNDPFPWRSDYLLVYNTYKYDECFNRGHMH